MTKTCINRAISSKISSQNSSNSASKPVLGPALAGPGATRYDKTARNFLAAVFLVGAYIWLN